MAQLTGAAGELFLYEVLSQHLPGFGAGNWLSGNRSILYELGHEEGPVKLPEAEPSFDFMYLDSTGQLSGHPGTMCYIECKATAADVVGNSNSPMPIPITASEWRVAQEIRDHRLAGIEQALYIVVRVDRVCVQQPGKARVAAVLCDPVQMLLDEQLRVGGDMYMYAYAVDPSGL